MKAWETLWGIRVHIRTWLTNPLGTFLRITCDLCKIFEKSVWAPEQIPRKSLQKHLGGHRNSFGWPLEALKTYMDNP